MGHFFECQRGQTQPARSTQECRPLIGLRRIEVQMSKRLGRGDSTTRRTENQFTPQQKWFDFVSQRIGDRIHRCRQRFNPCRPTHTDSNQRIQIFSILPIQSQAIDLGHLQRITSNFQSYFSGRAALSKITHPTKPIVCLLYTSPSPRDRQKSRMPSSA